MAENEAQETTTHVAEVPGLYGTIPFPEKLLQRIWLLKKFHSQSCTLCDGRPLRILSAGNWNRLQGPDFFNAQIEIDGKPHLGDIEIHFHARQWSEHTHDADPAYNNVILHVVLYEPPHTHTHVTTESGNDVPTLFLLPYLECSLEEFAIEDAIECITAQQRTNALDALFQIPIEERRALLLYHARIRWEQKLTSARTRIEQHGWEEACHQTALEILGYRFNRAPMLSLATRIPWATWKNTLPIGADIWAESIENWQLQAVRPANHPKTRLEQYARWMTTSPDWPRYLLENSLNTQLAEDPSLSTINARRFEGFNQIHTTFFERITGRTIGGDRHDTLICNGFLPLLAAKTGAPYFARWFHWWPSETGSSTEDLRQTSVCDGNQQPLCEGLAQGMLLYTAQFKANI